MTNDDAYWIYKEGDEHSIGIKIFPRVGSTSILKVFGFGQSKEQFDKADHKFVVVRDPFERLLSVYYGMFRAPKRDWRMQDRGYPAPKDLNDFVQFLVRSNPEELDIHSRPMSLQLGDLKPKMKELYLLKDFLENPPKEVAPWWHWQHKGMHEHKSSIPDPIPDKIDQELIKQWAEMYSDDYALFNKAQKAALKREGQKAADDAGE